MVPIPGVTGNTGIGMRGVAESVERAVGSDILSDAAPITTRCDSMSKGTIVKVSGPLVIASGMRGANMFDVVRVSDKRLIGEIIEMHGDRASIQVYEETSGLGAGEEVESTGAPLSVELGPGLIGGIFDGIQRPLEKIRALIGNNLTRGVEVPSLDREKKWAFVPAAKPGDRLAGGDLLGTVRETAVVAHKIFVPPGLSGTLESLEEESTP